MSAKSPHYNKRHYIEIGDILRKALPVYGSDIRTFKAVVKVSHSFTKLFEKDNPRFNASKFHHHIFKEDNDVG